MSMNTNEIKNLLTTASASNGEPDTNWSAEAVDRLYFFDPKNQETSGCVDVQRSADGAPGPARVRLELWIEPAKAAEIIAMVTGARASLEVSVCRLVNAGKLPAWVKEANELRGTAKGAPAGPPPPVTFGSSKKPTLEERDQARAAELSRLIAAQKKEADDERNEHDEPEEEAEEKDDLPEEVNFDEPAGPDSFGGSDFEDR